MIRLEKAYKRYPKGVEALKEVDLSFPEKGLVIIQGKSGCGKSTLLNIIGGLDVLTSGKLYCDGAEISERNFEDYRREKVSFVFQDFQLFEDMTVEENIGVASEITGEVANPLRISEILKSVDMEEYAKSFPNELSGGQMQRVAIARGLMKEGATILADEPTGNLDSENAENVFKLLQRISKERLVIAVTHDREFADLYADFKITMKDGRIIESNLKTEAENDEEGKELKGIKGKKLSFKTVSKLARWSLGKKKGRQITIGIIAVILLACCTSLVGLAYVSETSVAVRSADKSENSTYLVERVTQSYIESENLRKMSDKHNIKYAKILRIENKNPNIKMDDNGNLVYNTDQYYWETTYAAFTDNIADFGIEIVDGAAPNDTFDICVPKIYADYILRHGEINVGYDINQNIIPVETYRDLIGKTIYLKDYSAYAFKISGIFEDNSALPEKYRYIDPPRTRGKISSIEDEAERLRISTIFEEEYTPKTMFLSEKAYSILANKTFGNLNSQAPYSIKINGNDLDEQFNSNSGVFESNFGFAPLLEQNLELPIELNGINPQGNSIYVSNNFAELSGFSVGDSFEIEPYIEGIKIVGGKCRVQIAGIYQKKSGKPDTIYTSQTTLNNLFPVENYFDLLLYAEDISNPAAALSSIKKAMDANNSDKKYDACTIYADGAKTIVLNTEMIGDLKLYVALPVLVIVVALAIMLISTFLTMNVDAKTREIGVLKSMGARRTDVNTIFVFQSAVIIAIMYAAAQILGGLVLFGINKVLDKMMFQSTFTNAIVYNAQNFFFVLLGVIAVGAASVAWQLKKLNNRTAVEIMKNQTDNKRKKS